MGNLFTTLLSNDLYEIWDAHIRNDHKSAASRRDATIGSQTNPSDCSHLVEMRLHIKGRISKRCERNVCRNPCYQ